MARYPIGRLTMDDDNPKIGSPEYLRALADCFGCNEDITLGSTDQALCKQALLDRADLIDAGLA
ncbi:hypothetical protein [Bradyrhizobium sp. AC87j1]|uniref:hypothetical protein n=1 Tax=Bradyrhizobium sp. AC87j1 TaxID=2055894 RepID=UPI0013750254|nr:hypothetical protein [Bradyrhizobium sp. AC87j1]